MLCMTSVNIFLMTLLDFKSSLKQHDFYFVYKPGMTLCAASMWLTNCYMTITDTEMRNLRLQNGSKWVTSPWPHRYDLSFSYYRKLRQTKVSLCWQLKSWLFSWCHVILGMDLCLRLIRQHMNKSSDNFTHFFIICFKRAKAAANFFK